MTVTAYELASDGGLVTIRLARPGDRTAPLRFLLAAHADEHLTLVALDGSALIGVAACARLGEGSPTAEVVCHVAPHHRGRGVSTLLLEHLSARARPVGITEFVGDVPDRGVALRPLLEPRSVVVIGAGPRHGGAGHETLRALRDYGFAGRLYAVDPAGRPVCGLPAHRGVSDLPEIPDLAVVAVRADLVPAALKEAGQFGVRCAVVLSKGFGSSGPVNRQRRAEVLQISREQGIRVLGPSSIGVLSTAPRSRLNACLSPERPPAGGLAVAAQSGAVGIALLADAARSACGLSGFVSLGEELDIDENDLVSYWYDDPGTRAVALCLESIRDPGEFARMVRALGRRKPVLAVTRAGALLEPAGVICTTGIGEMLDTARVLIGQPAPAGARMAIVGNGGGLTALAADRAEASGFTLLPLTPPTRRQVPRGRDNPIDLGIDASPAAIATAAECVADSGEADILLLMIVGTRANCPIAIMTALGSVVDNHPDVTIAAVLTGGNDGIQTFGERGAPVYPEAERAVRALAYAHRYAVWRQQPLSRRPRLEAAS
jgi:acyl-CoA synthetase (NDP forming)